MNIYDFQVRDSKDTEISLSDYKNKVIIVVNTASKCGFTPQYKELQSLYESYKEKGFVILGFPCNQFRNQEPSNNDEIQSFCEINFGVTFPVLGKVDVNGKYADPLFKFLKSESPGILGTQKIKWNFTKFIIDKRGNVVKRVPPLTKPRELCPLIEKLLSESL